MANVYVHWMLWMPLCVYWQFKASEWDRKREASLKVPIFAACYSPYCGVCRGVVEAVRDFGDDREDIITTLVNCHEGDCGLFPARRTPTFVIVIGWRQKYWRVIESKDQEVWQRELDQWAKVRMEKIESEEQIGFRGDESSFHLDIQSESDGFFNHVKDELGLLIAFQTITTYRVGQVRGLYVFRSPSCGRRFNGRKRDVADWLYLNKFSYKHNYDHSDWIFATYSGSAVLLVVADSPSSAELTFLDDLCGKFCEEAIAFGWASPKSNPDFMKNMNLTNATFPFLMFGHRTFLSFTANLSNSVSFINTSLAQTMPALYIKGYVLIAIYCLFCFLLIALIRAQAKPRSMLE